ncbi:MAG: hypothetical protein BWY69_01767 [Planctomycetes bacterium ADurb.Bin401]|nr:MAG: hypothetical protein BWY69_01767 [Planctomycetes bacterium ADurb.Bin401]
MKKVLYLGDTSLSGSASYLAAIMAYHNVDFDYLPSDSKFDDQLLNNDYCAFVISDYPAANFSESQIDKIILKIKSGAGLLMIGGWESFTGLAGSYNRTALTEVLPVIMEDFDDRMNLYCPSLVVRNQSHIITDALPIESHTPLMGGFNRFRVKRFGCEVLSIQLFKAEQNNNDFKFTIEERYPLLVTGAFGDANITAFASDVAPHWVGPLVDWGDKRITSKAPYGEQVEVGNWYAQLFINMIFWTANMEVKC